MGCEVGCGCWMGWVVDMGCGCPHLGYFPLGVVVDGLWLLHGLLWVVVVAWVVVVNGLERLGIGCRLCAWEFVVVQLEM